MSEKKEKRERKEKKDGTRLVLCGGYDAQGEEWEAWMTEAQFEEVQRSLLAGLNPGLSLALSGI